MWVEFNNNPVAARVGDCAVRAVSKALDISWEAAYTRMALNGFLMGDMPSSNNVWGAVLRQSGFNRQAVPNTCPDCYTVADFCRDNPDGIYVLGLDKHVVTAVDGSYYDTWNSGNEPVVYFWYKPKGPNQPEVEEEEEP